MSPPASHPHHSPDSASPIEEGRHTLENATLAHVAGMLIFAAWAFGGNVEWARTLIALWGALAVPLMFLNTRDVLARRHCLPRVILCLWPFVLFNALVIASLFFPGFSANSYGGELMFINNDVSPLIPSSARPNLALAALGVFDAIYLTSFNLLLAIRSRHAFRLLLLILSFNGLALAVFGTVQKLTHATGLYFGLQPSPQPRFFASFIYHNHWGAFTILMLSLGLGLFFHFLRRHEGRAFLNSPAMLVATSVALLAISVPLSGSRSTSLIVAALMTIAMLNWIWTMMQRRKADHLSNAGLTIGALILFILLIGVSYKLAEPVIRERMSDTHSQIAMLKDAGVVDSRAALYRDTWEMASERLWFGWGMASYPTVFKIYNSQYVGTADRLPKFFRDAHSDWLQSLAEVGLVGTALLVLCALVPLWSHRGSLGRSPISNYLLGGVALLIVYSLVEFPFGNTAVVIAFWICLFTAIRYGRIETNHLD